MCSQYQNCLSFFSGIWREKEEEEKEEEQEGSESRSFSLHADVREERRRERKRKRLVVAKGGIFCPGQHLVRLWQIKYVTFTF